MLPNALTNLKYKNIAKMSLYLMGFVRGIIYPK